jgi:hypothetical protein
MGEKRNVPVLSFIGNLVTDPKAFANDAVDAADAKLTLNPAWEALADAPKQMIKDALAEVINDRIVVPMSAHTIECES